jgi:hypothetical protein
MGRGRLYTRGMHGQVRFLSRSRELTAKPSTALRMDSILRRASSISRFVIRLDAVPSRRELVVRFAALRHEPTQRAEAAVLPLIRRFLPEAAKNEWVRLEHDADASAFVTYELVETDVAEREMTDLQSNPTHLSCLSTSDVPAVEGQPAPPPAASTSVVRRTGGS